jgi:hypothetical protein
MYSPKKRRWQFDRFKNRYHYVCLKEDVMLNIFLVYSLSTFWAEGLNIPLSLEPRASDEEINNRGGEE